MRTCSMSNFTFIPSHWANIAQTPQEAEQHVHAASLYAAMLCRKSLEEWVQSNDGVTAIQMIIKGNFGEGAEKQLKAMLV